METFEQKQQALYAVAKDLSEHAPCPLRKTALHAVPGEGNPDAQILFIGEAPGKKEDETGRPFVGAAGKVLDELLASIGIKREDVFITSIEKFRPPKNRPPKREEIMACFPYLEKQIAIIQPGLIVPLGRHALKRMLEWEDGKEMPETLFMKHRVGKLLESKHGHRYFPVYHPAAALYNRALYKTLLEEFSEIPKLL